MFILFLSPFLTTAIFLPILLGKSSSVCLHHTWNQQCQIKSVDLGELLYLGSNADFAPFSCVTLGLMSTFLEPYFHLPGTALPLTL